MRSRYRLVLLFVLVGVVACGRRVSESEGEGGTSAGSGSVLAEVGGRSITEGDLAARLDEIPRLTRPEFSTPAGRERLLRQMIEEEVLWLAARERGVHEEDAVRHEVDRATRTIVVQAYLDRMQEELTRVDEDEARAFYEEHRDEYVTERRLRVRLFQSNERSFADHAHTLVVEQDVPMENVCAKWCDEPNLKEARGMLPQWVRRGKAISWIGNHPRFHEVVFALEMGGVSEVFETSRGWHFAQVEDESESRARPFEEVRGDVEGRISRARSTTRLPQLLAELRDRYEVQVLETGRTPEDVFAEAQKSPDPRQAIALYEELVERWPDHERVAESLFMIGFKKSEDLADPEGAELAFRRLLEAFPESELAQSARWMLTSEGDEVPEFEDASAGSPEGSTP